MLRSIALFIGAGLFMLSAGCGVSKARYETLEAEKVRVETEYETVKADKLRIEQENAGHLEKLRDLEAKVEPLEARVTTLSEDLDKALAEAQNLRQQALDADAQAKNYLAQMKDMEAADARTAAQIAQVRALAEKLQTDIRKLLEVASADTSRGTPQTPVVTERTVDTEE